MKQANSSSAPTGRPQHQNKLLVTWPWRHHCWWQRAGVRFPLPALPGWGRLRSLQTETALCPSISLTPSSRWWLLTHLLVVHYLFALHLAETWDTTEYSAPSRALNNESCQQPAVQSICDSHWDNERRYCGCVVCRSVPLQNTWILRPNYVALQHFLSGVFIFNSTDVTFLWMLTLTNCLCSKWKLISLWVFDVWAWADISAPPLAPWHTWPLAGDLARCNHWSVRSLST